MRNDIPSQRIRCTTYEWCASTDAEHRTHVGPSHVSTASRGTRLRMSMSAEGGQEPRIHVEAEFEPGGPLMSIAELDASEALEVAGVLLRLARLAHAPQDVDH